MSLQTPRCILVVDDHPAILLGLKFAIQGEWPACEVIGVNSGKEALNTCRVLNPDIVLLDYQMPDMNGYLTARQLLQFNAQTRVLLFTFLDSLPVAANFLAIGGRGFMTKDADLQTLFDAIINIMNGKYYFHSSHDSQLSEMVIKGIQANLPKIEFTQRELEICLKISKGLTAKMIGQELNISQRTVESYKETLLAKTGVKSTAELIAFIYRNGVNPK